MWMDNLIDAPRTRVESGRIYVTLGDPDGSQTPGSSATDVDDDASLSWSSRSGSSATDEDDDASLSSRAGPSTTDVDDDASLPRRAGRSATDVDDDASLSGRSGPSADDDASLRGSSRPGSSATAEDDDASLSGRSGPSATYMDDDSSLRGPSRSGSSATDVDDDASLSGPRRAGPSATDVDDDASLSGRSGSSSTDLDDDSSLSGRSGSSVTDVDDDASLSGRSGSSSTDVDDDSSLSGRSASSATDVDDDASLSGPRRAGPSATDLDDDASLPGPSRSGDSRVPQSGFVDELVASFHAGSWQLAEECRTLEEAEGIARRVLVVYRTLPPDPEAQNEWQNEMLMKTLMLCCRFKVTDSRLVCDLLDVGLDNSPPPAYLYVPPGGSQAVWFDDLGYLQYLLEHCRRTGRDAPRGCWSNFESDARPFRNMFSVSRAVARGDFQRTLLLLRHGLREEDVRELDEGTDLRNFLWPPDFQLDSKRLPTLVLLRQTAMFAFYLHIAKKLTEDKLKNIKSCLMLLWNTLPDAYVDFNALIEPLRLLNIFEQVVFKNCPGQEWVLDFLEYVDHYFGIAVREFRPRSLKHLCRCAIRGKLAENRQLPTGILQLKLPEELQKYVDLFDI